MSKKTAIWLILLIVIAALIRLSGLLTWDNYLFDELVSVRIAEQPVAQMWSYLQWEMHPPLHFYYLHYWLQIFGSSEPVARASSLILGLLAIFASFYLGKEFFKSERAGLYTALITALSAFQNFYSVWVRMYIMLFLFGSLSSLFFLKALRENKQKWWWLWGLFNILAIYTNLTALALPVIQILFVAYLKYKQQVSLSQIKKTIIILFINGLLFLPWVYNFITVRLQNFSGRAWYFWGGNLDIYFINLPLKLLITGNERAIVEVLAILVFGGLILFGLFNLKKTNETYQLTSLVKPAHILSLLIVIVPLLGGFALGLNNLRFFTISAIGLHLLIAAGLAGIASQYWRKLATMALIGVFIVPTAQVIKLPEVGWTRIGNFIEEREQKNDLIIAAAHPQILMINEYYDGTLPVDTILEPEKKEADILMMLIKTNFTPAITDENLKLLAETTQGYDRVFLVFPHKLFGRSHEPVIEWFMADGWQLQEQLALNEFTQPTVWLLTKLNTP